MSTSNIIPFPKQNINIQKQTSIEEIKNNIEMMRHYHIQETIANLAPIIFNQLEIAGFPISNEEETDIKDGAFIIESLRSLMCKYYDIYHPFQQISDGVFFPDEIEIGALRIVDKLNLELKKSETA
jgi:hypothetical protein